MKKDEQKNRVSVIFGKKLIRQFSTKKEAEEFCSSRKHRKHFQID